VGYIDWIGVDEADDRQGEAFVRGWSRHVIQVIPVKWRSSTPECGTGHNLTMEAIPNTLHRDAPQPYTCYADDRYEITL
jgi:hypothetical protein